jgi:holo-[acyl-carrier protein] synthase
MNGSHVTEAGVEHSWNDEDRGAAMVIGLGTDLMEIARIEASIARYGEQFLQRVFTAGEIAYCRRKQKTAAESFAARFAAKEAGAKALGTGIAQGVSWREIEVRRAPGQRPEIEFTGRAAERAKAMGMVRASLSLTHSRDMAMAVVVLEGRSDQV